MYVHSSITIIIYDLDCFEDFSSYENIEQDTSVSQINVEEVSCFLEYQSKTSSVSSLDWDGLCDNQVLVYQITFICNHKTCRNF